ncbi:MAG: hypothetical protein GF417_10195 [Candidatus Latescibacteria bacterium]|nr:hypothetical protein [bacterium]MBD3424797.1 hypothetical protein [Candidatus Latescibacterota bacterium]
MRKRRRILGVLSLFILLALTGCSGEDTVGPLEDQKAPVLPPVESMSMDLGLFHSAGIDRQQVYAAGTEGYDIESEQVFRKNFLNAAVRALYLEVVVYSAMVDPVAAFAVASHSVPQRQDDGSWLWTYIFMEEGVEYSIFLYGKPGKDYSTWRMEVSSSHTGSPMDHFLWFEGEMLNDESGGWWQFYEPAEEGPVQYASESQDMSTPGEETIRVNWENTSGSSGSVTFLVNRVSDPAMGSTLTFSETEESGSIEYYDASKGATGSIIWYQDGSGSISWPDYNGGELSCWDTAQIDTICR